MKVDIFAVIENTPREQIQAIHDRCKNNCLMGTDGYETTVGILCRLVLYFMDVRDVLLAGNLNERTDPEALQQLGDALYREAHRIPEEDPTRTVSDHAYQIGEMAYKRVLYGLGKEHATLFTMDRVDELHKRAEAAERRAAHFEEFHRHVASQADLFKIDKPTPQDETKPGDKITKIVIAEKKQPPKQPVMVDYNEAMVPLQEKIARLENDNECMTKEVEDLQNARTVLERRICEAIDANAGLNKTLTERTAERDAAKEAALALESTLERRIDQADQLRRRNSEINELRAEIEQWKMRINNALAALRETATGDAPS